MTRARNLPSEVILAHASYHAGRLLGAAVKRGRAMVWFIPRDSRRMRVLSAIADEARAGLGVPADVPSPRIREISRVS